MLDGDPTSEKASAMIFSRSHPDCFIGITSWNSEAFLGPCLDQIGKTARGRVRVVVLDNASTDRSAEVASSRGAEVTVKKCDQWQAMNCLLKMSRSRYTLLIHSDVILLHDDWLDVCAAEMPGNVALVAPEDVGCGPYTRPWGKGMPEGSFLFFDTRKAMSARKVFWRQRFKMKLPYRAFDFTGDHITYNVPRVLAQHGYAWRMMRVHMSTREPEPVYVPNFKPKYWGESFSHLRYGLGNFYSLDSQVTHYHNWFDRVGLGSDAFDPASTETVPPEGGIPKAYLQICSRRFLDDLTSGALRVPEIGAISTPA
jgi:glycosyltransferase involved in cell wall biosynthesis